MVDNIETNKKYILNKTNQLLENKGKLLYLSVVGSHLFNTNNENSDIDIRGVYLPNKKDLLLGKKLSNISWTTNNTQTHTSNDIDIELWPLQTFLTNYCKKGDMNSVDLLFSDTNKKCVLYIDKIYKKLDYTKLIDISENNKFPYMGYIESQYYKYFNKIKKYKLLNCLYEDLITYKDSNNSLHIIYDYFDKKQKEKDSIISFTVIDGQKYVKVIDKKYNMNIKLSEFLQLINNSIELYGNRIKNTANTNYIDYKCLYHVLRCIYQLLDIISDGYTCFPSNKADYLKQVKEGKVDLDEIERQITINLFTLKHNKNIIKNSILHYDEIYVKNFILKLYDNKFYYIYKLLNV